MTRLHSNRLTNLLALALCLPPIATTHHVSANDLPQVPPLPMGNRTPFTLIHIAPVAPDYTLATGQHQWSSHFDISSHSLIERTENATAELDGETTRIALGWQYRPSARWIVRAELPLISHSGGFLDSLIDDWHRITGLPEGQRTRQPQDELLFLVDNANRNFELNSSKRALGDLHVSAAYQLFTTATSVPSSWQSNSWVQLALKLPTGRLESLTGSNTIDVAVSLHHNRQQRNATRPLTLSFDAFAIRLGNEQQIAPQKDLNVQLQVKLAKQWTQHLIPEVQLRHRSAGYESPLDTLGSSSLGVDVGVTLLRRHGHWKLGISEDLDVDSAPDIGLYLQYTRRLK